MNIELYPDQQIAYKTILSRYKKGSYNRVQLLPASLGWGKSFCATKLAHTLSNEKKKVMIICPPTLRIQWRKLFNKYNVPLDYIYSYNEIRGRRGKIISIDKNDIKNRGEAKVNNIFLTRGNDKIGPFETTKEFEDICREGLFIIFDESQFLKNRNSSTHWAAFALIKTAMKYNSTNIIHLSASVIDKDDNWQSFFRIMGLINIKKLKGKKKDLWKDSGIGSLYEISKQANCIFTCYVFNMYKKRQIKISELLKLIWVNIFKKLLIINVKDVIHFNNKTKIDNHIQNGFYHLDDKGVIQANDAIKILKYNKIIKPNGSIDIEKANGIGKYQHALMKLASSKNDTVIRITLNDLKKYPNSKIILCIGFNKDQYYLNEKLKDYGVLLLNSKTSFKKRVDIINQFNQPNLNTRILIMSPQIGGTGINLHDIYGDFPRRMYVVPTFHFLSMYQVTGRTYRRDVKSNVFVSFVYGNNTAIENVFVNTMIKSKITKSLVGIDERLFPDNYYNYIEKKYYYYHLKSTITTKLLDDINNDDLINMIKYDNKQFEMDEYRTYANLLNMYTIIPDDTINIILEMLT